MDVPWVPLVGFVGTSLVALLVLWPREGNGERLLKKWGIAEPNQQQVEEGVRYLKRRRLLYPWLYGALWLLPQWGNNTTQLLVVVLTGTLLAELIALRPRRDARREATLTRRGLFDIASGWVVLLYAVIAICSAVYLGLHQRWDLLGWLALSVVAVAVITWAAVARPATGDGVVDKVLRTRSVHVSAGLGAAVAVAVTLEPRAGFVGLLLWIGMANTKPDPAKITP
ncbi:hypothetical protein [Lentzea sp. NPDC051838]|uniref:hypothetical protein n=1 Tax=Lentzea sp. NPDC051838 TaxID=3154849 RepID=UPI00343E6C08